ncbi:MAG: EamA family transporter, partial [Pseudomonadota bacterium]
MSLQGGIRPIAGIAIGPLAAGMLAVVIWGATPAATKYAVAEIDAFAVGMLRTVLAGLAVAPVILLLRLPLPRDGGGWRLLLISTASGFVSFP